MDPSQTNRHPATNGEQCLKMERRNGWTLIGVDPTGVPILTVDCIFSGPQVEFDNPYADLGDDNNDDEQ